MATTPQYQHPIFKYSELAANRRGLIINQTINLEKVIDWRIAQHFCKDDTKREELEALIISGLPFSKKIDILIYLLEKHDNDFFKAHKSAKRHLHKIRENRNNMAHSWLDVSVTFVGKKDRHTQTVSRLFTNNKLKKEQLSLYDEKRIAALNNMIIKYTHVLMHW